MNHADLVNAALAFHAPLLVGQHTITLDEKIFIPEYDLTLEFHNTWNVTVKAGK